MAFNKELIYMRKLRILLSLMGLEIGGAETHAVELAKSLKNNGYLVYVVSSGGVYEKELEENNIPHFYAPLTSKSPLNMLKSYNTIKKIVVKEKIDLIHAHARIPAFVSSLVKKRLGVPLISTVHGVYSTKFWFKMLTNWGDEAICVSEDIKDYVIENYDFSSLNTSVTINGIDTDKFTPNTFYYDVMQEFKISEDDFKIVCVTRLDEGNSHAAYSLLKASDNLVDQIENLKIIIVGGGNEFEKIKNLCNSKNASFGKDVFVMTNARVDVHKFLAMSDLFVGISRAALEAMATQRCVILNGQFGYGGIFSEDNLDECLANNFTARGSNPSDETFFDDIMKIYALSDDEKHQMGIFARDVVNKHYSVSTMAEDTEKIYHKVNNEQKYNYDFMISGYYGFNNSGDDALLQAMIDPLKSIDENLRIVVLSKKCEETIKRYKVDAINRMSIFKILKCMTHTKVLISGGGSLIQDVTSTKSIFYYLGIIFLGLIKRTSIMVYANGIGPINKKLNRIWAKKALDKVDVITLREEGSLNLLEEIGVENQNIYLTSDPALSLQITDNELIENVLKSHSVPESTRLLGVSVRDFKKNDKDFAISFAKKLDEICEKNNVYPLFLPMQFPYDYEFSLKIIKHLKTPYYIINAQYDERIFAGIISKCELLIGMRLHSLIYSASVKVPVVGIVYDPKVKSFLDYIGQTHYVDAKNIASDVFVDTVNDCFLRRFKIKEEFEKRICELSKKAFDNAKIAIKLLNRENDSENTGD